MSKNKYKQKKAATTTVYTKVENKIKSYKDLKHGGIILMDNNAMQDFRTKSGPLADSCEYQVHYWALVIRARGADRTILDVCIPTTFFNYKQEVTGARIDFELEDVDTVSEAVEPIHNKKINELINSGIVDEIKSMFPDERTFELLSTNLNSIHKHPGGIRQSFSGTDLTTSHVHDTGIVFPLGSGEFKPNFAGIMAHVGQENKVAHFEYRIANGAVGDGPNDVINYYKGRCVCIIRSEKEGIPEVPAVPAIPASSTEMLFGSGGGTPAVPGKPEVLPVVNTYYASDEVKENEIRELALIQGIKEIWEGSEFEQSRDFVFPENVARKTYAPVYNYAGKTVSSTTKGTGTVAQEIVAAHNRTKTFQEEWNEKYGTGSKLVDEDTEQDDFVAMANDTDYMRRISEIEWKSEKELQLMGLLELSNETKRLKEICYEFYQNTGATMSMSREILVNDYKSIKDVICAELEEYAEYDEDPYTELGVITTREEIMESLKELKIEEETFNMEKSSFKDMKTFYRKMQL